MRKETDQADDFEAVADALLRLHGTGRISNEYPAYVEKYLQSRARRRGEVSLEEVFVQSQAEIRQVSNVVTEIGWCEIRSGANKVGLTDRQMEFLALARTLNNREISETTGWSCSTVSRELKAAAVALQSIPGFGVWTVLAEVFRLPVGRIKDLIKNN